VLGGRPGEEWGPEDRRILTALGQQAALAAQNVRLIAELRAKVAEVEEVHRRLLVAREEERADLARELHDGVIQDLVGLRYRLEALQEELEGARSDDLCRPVPKAAEVATTNERFVSKSIEEMHAQVGQLLDELRRLCSDLRPPALDQLGLAAALQALAREVTARGLPVEVHLEDFSLPDGAAIGLYRICQEALSNALHHAGASCAIITLSRDGNEVTLMVADDGHGFDPAAARRRAGRFGLLGMVERAEALGGHLAVESAPGEGTRVTARCEIRE
jgi:signal transduction histidine kinase